jgi:hypothetical protein
MTPTVIYHINGASSMTYCDYDQAVFTYYITVVIRAECY